MRTFLLGKSYLSEFMESLEREALAKFTGLPASYLKEHTQGNSF